MSAVLATLTGYLLGSIPTAYLVTRYAIGKDIRRIGGGNVGGLNTFREVGFLPAAIVAIVDLSKGAAAVSLAYWVFNLDTPFVLLAGLASVIGHNWMLFLKFSGGKGMAPTFGSLAVLMPLYGYPEGLIILTVVMLIPFVITRNIALTMGIGLVALPFITWLGMNSAIGTLVAVIVGIIIGIKFLPTTKVAVARNKTARGFIFDRGRGD